MCYGIIFILKFENGGAGGMDLNRSPVISKCAKLKLRVTRNCPTSILKTDSNSAKTP